MLRELRIRNFAVVENVTVPFAPGFNVLTGETGAGKSILVDAILLVRGARAQTEVIRADADSATVEAVFAAAGGAVAAVLDEAGLAVEEGEIVVRRELSRGGRHRAFVNDAAVTVGLLERLGDALVQVHGQHEHQRLLEPARQLDLLDRFADAEPQRERFAALFTKHREARAELEARRGAGRDRAQREDLLRFQVGELDAARLRPGEQEELRTERRRLQHAERFAAGLEEVGTLLRDDAASAAARLARAARVLGELGRLDPAFAAPVENLEAARLQVDEALAAIRALRDTIVFEPGRLEAIDDRLDALTRLARKYGDSEEAMLRYRAEAAAELDRLERHEELLGEDERRLAELEGEMTAAAAALGQARRQAAAKLGPAVQRELRQLGMERATFEAAVMEVALADWGPRGAERVEFRFTANPGEPARPLARIASGGELARTMLALQVVLSGFERAPTMVFDEVDAGIGGRAASVVGEKLAAVGAGRQVLCVTHLAPIAALAHQHVRVAKSVRGGRTRASAEVVAGPDRAAEIARMLGGDASGAAALDHARALLGARGPRGPKGRGV
ncbi:MAG TPA: DNA repair protein RecN [Methylomirabilota bacterium]|jgi:DNA repair protein RecN (Recombination protein N)|nr:DNA repair protein RecN [Methylomirabilota bacterium]